MFNFIKQPANDPYNFDMGSKPKAPTQSIGKATPVQTKAALPAKPNAAASKQQVAANKNTEKPKNIETKRLGIRYDPPTIILEYLVPNTGKLYHHKMKLLKLKADTPPQHALEYLKKKHSTFFINNKIPEGQLIDLIVKLTKRLPMPNKVRPATASTIASKTQNNLAKDLKSYNMQDEDKPNSKFSKNPIIQNYDEDDQDEDEYEEEDEDEMTDEQYKMLYKQMGYDKLDFNKMTTQEILKHKQMMDNMLRTNGIQSQLDNEWDMEEDEDYDIV